MKVKALKSFQSKSYGFITAGSKFNCEPGYARDLERNKLIEILEEDAPGPNDNKAVPTPPVTRQPTVRAPDAGAVPPSSSLEADLASRLTTSKPFAPGAKRATKPRIATVGARPAK